MELTWIISTKICWKLWNMKRRVKLKTTDRHDSNPEESSEPQPSTSAEIPFEIPHRSSWHGASLEEEVPTQGNSGIVSRSCSQGNLQQVKFRSRVPRPRLRLFNRRSLPVNLSTDSTTSEEADQSESQGTETNQSASPKHKTGQSGLRSLFENIHRRKQANKHKSVDKENKNDLPDRNEEAEQTNNRESRVRTSPEIEGFPDFKCDSVLLDERRRRSDSSLLEERREGISQTGDMQRSKSSGSNLSLEAVNQSEQQTDSRAQIETFQRTHVRGTHNPSRFSIFGRSRSNKTVIKDVQDNLIHPVLLGILSLMNFLLWIFLSSVKVCRISAVVFLWLWLKMAYTFEFLVKCFHRIFNLDPDKVNQNNDYTHIEGKYPFYPKYWDIPPFYHTCPKIWTSHFCYLWIFLKMLDEWQTV